MLERHTVEGLTQTVEAAHRLDDGREAVIGAVVERGGGGGAKTKQKEETRKQKAADGG